MRQDGGFGLFVEPPINSTCRHLNRRNIHPVPRKVTERVVFSAKSFSEIDRPTSTHRHDVSICQMNCYRTACKTEEAKTVAPAVGDTLRHLCLIILYDLLYSIHKSIYRHMLQILKVGEVYQSHRVQVSI